METENGIVSSPTSCSVSSDFKTEYETYLSEAESFSPAEIQVCRLDTDVVANNVQRGVLAISEVSIAERIRRELPSLVLEQMYDLPRLAATVAHAARQVLAAPPSNAEVQEAIARGFVIRKQFQAGISLLVAYGVLRPEALESLRKGRGVIDLANGLIDGAAVLARAECDAGPRILLGAEVLDEARQVAKFIKDHVAPAAGKPVDTARAEAVATRDRLWTLLVHRYDLLRRAATWLWGDEPEPRVPPLGSWQGRPRRVARVEQAPAVTPAEESGDEVVPQTEPQGEQVPPAEPQPEPKGEEVAPAETPAEPQTGEATKVAA